MFSTNRAAVTKAVASSWDRRAASFEDIILSVIWFETTGYLGAAAAKCSISTGVDQLDRGLESLDAQAAVEDVQKAGAAVHTIYMVEHIVPGGESLDGQTPGDQRTLPRQRRLRLPGPRRALNFGPIESKPTRCCIANILLTVAMPRTEGSERRPHRSRLEELNLEAKYPKQLCWAAEADLRQHLSWTRR